MFVYKIRDLTRSRVLSYTELQTTIDALNSLEAGKFDILRMVPVVEAYRTLKELELDDYKNAEAICHLGFKKPFFDEGNQVLEVLSGKKGKDYFLHEGVVVRGLNNEFSFKIKDAEYAYDFSGKE